MTLDELNRLSTEAFIHKCEPLLEHCGWALTQLADARPFASVSEMQDRLADLILNAPDELKMQALLMHPKLGAGKAQPGFSQSEQAQAGLTQLTDEELDLFTQLNSRYEARMGYPFVVAVTGMNKADILDLMALRSVQPKEAEWPIAVTELIKIAQIRVAKLFS